MFYDSIPQSSQVVTIHFEELPWRQSTPERVIIGTKATFCFFDRACSSFILPPIETWLYRDPGASQKANFPASMRLWAEEALLLALRTDTITSLAC